MEPGLYVTFFSEGESSDSALPPIGPLEHLVVRDGSLVADRKDGGRADVFDGGGRWIEAEYEFQRATGKEPGGARRSELRIVAPQGVYLRFVSFGSAAEPDPVPELGPYAVVVVGKRTVEADGDRLASRMGSKQNLWELTGVGGSALLGVIRPDIAFRTRSTVYHPELTSFRPVQPAAAAARSARPLSPAATLPSAPAPTRPAEPHPPAPRAPSAPAPTRPATPLPPAPRQTTIPAPASRVTEPAGITLLDRIRAEQSTRPDSMVASEGGERREWAGAAWRMRYVIIAALVVLVAVLSIPSILSLATRGSPGASTVGIGTAVTSPEWTYNVGTVRRVSRIGASQARGTYLVVQIAATNRGRAGAELLPSNFSLTAAGGEEYAASATTSGVYATAENQSSSFKWPTEFPVGQSVVLPIIFDVNPSVSGTQLVIFDVPSTRVRLE